MTKRSTVVPKITSRHKYNGVLDYLLEGCQLISHDFRYLYVNDTVVRQGKTSRKNLLGKTMMECYPGIEKTSMFELLKACMRDGTVHTLENPFSFSDGTHGWFELRIEPTPEGALILSIDITERKRAEERNQRLDELKSSFIRIVSHQLRTPLTATGWTLEEILNNPPKHTSDYLRAIEKAHGYNEEVSTRLGDLLRALDIEEQRVTILRKPVQLERLIAAVARARAAQAAQAGITITVVEPDRPLPKLSLDADEISNALDRLLANALIYSKGVNTVAIRMTAKPRTVRIEIEDHGIGIPAIEQADVFKQFYRASNAFLMEPSASGLGLYIAKHIVELHGGTMGFTSEQGAGSTFWIELPRKA